jgi:hypothetical protein
MERNGIWFIRPVRSPLGSEEIQAAGTTGQVQREKAKKVGNGLNADRYIRWILNGPLKRCVADQKRRRWRDILVLEDGAPAHSSKITKAARQKLGITSLVHPPSSPDPNPIENVWHLLKMKLSQPSRRATTIDVPWEQVKICWEEISVDTVN